MPRPTYIPILKGKEGEFGALESLNTEDKVSITPLIEIPPIPYDFVKDRPSKQLAEHIAAFPERIYKARGSLPVYIDLSRPTDNAASTNVIPAYKALYAGCSSAKVHCIPVLTRLSGSQSLVAAADYARVTQAGFALRLKIEDFNEDRDLESDIARLLLSLGGSPEIIDLVLDMGDLGDEIGKATLIARSILSMLPRIAEWRSLIIASSSFPEDLSEVDASSISKLPRLEWDLWQTLQRRPSMLPRRDMIFADYAISNPRSKEDIDPRKMRMSANIRYTTEDSWLILKGRNVKQYGFDQFFDLCRELVTCPEYAGRDFSWGDRYISDCAEAQNGPGNATIWRKVGVNHHIRLVTQMLSTLNREL